MKLGIAVEETWSFLHEIFADLSAHHEVQLFQRRRFDLPVFNTRVNRFLFRRDVGRFLKTNQVVFFEWASGLLAAATAAPHTTPLVARLHRYEMYRWADKINWDHVDRLVLVSKAKEKEFIHHFPTQAGKTVVIPEAISLDRFMPYHKPFAGDIGILCHLRPRKRVYELILAFSELAMQDADLHLHIGGGEAPGFEEYFEAVHALVRALHLNDRVTFYGHVNDPEAWYRKIDIFISNSYSEGLQVSPMEAIASGCFCLSHLWDGADELLPAEDLYFTDSQLQAKILEYCQATEAERRGRQRQQYDIVCERFNVDLTKVQIRQLLESVAAAR
ncbi:MAG TPA: glycosyltransferase family 4 protein [Candidatus Binatia bacterium]|nr:glycosyltransferase family 4 protein [Candidatus Binatia bacterium]